MKISSLLITLIFLLFACNQIDKRKTGGQPEQYEGVADTAVVETIPPLLEGEFLLTEKDFGEIIELHGTSNPVDQIFKISECELIALDSILIVKNLNNQDMFMVFTLPDFSFLKSFGRSGRGPGEFQFPSLVKDESGEFICFIYERTNNHLYSLNKDLEIRELPANFKEGERAMFNDKQLHGISSKQFFYVESTEMGKAIFGMDSENDTIKTTLIKNLAFSNKHKNWAAYIGDFGVNGKKNRAVFAYKNFKRLIFLDIENRTSKTVFFNPPGETKKGDAISMLDPSNITHYWGMSSNDKYVYILYSGRSPIDVSNELKNSSGYIYVEKFDWNGNPINKYKLDNWGYFCVNQVENTIYLASTSDEHPFVSFKLPKD
jgi:hypothetical protein